MMEKKENKKYELIGKIESINKGPNFKNATIFLTSGERVNVKLDGYEGKQIYVGNIYVFETIGVKKDEDIILKAEKIIALEDAKKADELESIYSKFYKSAPLPLTEMKKEIEERLDSIENKVLKDITKAIYAENKNTFYTHPAGTKFHHAYIGGLAYHTLCMLNLIDPFIKAYPYLNKSLLTAGVILHDMGKITEMTGVDGEYTTEGHLIGHLISGALDIERAALKLGYLEKEETLLLKHMIIAHHGQYNFGSPKKPMIPEALMLWYLDAIDSKFTVLGEEFELINNGEWTGMIAVLDKMKFYKSNIK